MHYLESWDAQLPALQGVTCAASGTMPTSIAGCSTACQNEAAAVWETSSTQSHSRKWCVSLARMKPTLRNIVFREEERACGQDGVLRPRKERRHIRDEARLLLLRLSI